MCTWAPSLLTNLNRTHTSVHAEMPPQSSHGRLFQLVFHMCWMSRSSRRQCRNNKTLRLIFPLITVYSNDGEAGHSLVLSNRLTHHLHITFTLIAVSMVISRTGLWELLLFSWRALHLIYWFTHLQHAVDGEGATAQSVWILWKGSNKAVSVMYVADMWLWAVAPAAAHVSHWRGINWGLLYMRSCSGELIILLSHTLVTAKSLTPPSTTTTWIVQYMWDIYASEWAWKKKSLLF